MPKLTKWFSDNIKPAYSGVYEVDIIGLYSYFDGIHWGWYCNSIEKADKERFSLYEDQYPSQNKLWRGLAENPE